MAAEKLLEGCLSVDGADPAACRDRAAKLRENCLPGCDDVPPLPCVERCRHKVEAVYRECVGALGDTPVGQVQQESGGRSVHQRQGSLRVGGCSLTSRDSDAARPRCTPSAEGASRHAFPRQPCGGLEGFSRAPPHMLNHMHSVWRCQAVRVPFRPDRARWPRALSTFPRKSQHLTIEVGSRERQLTPDSRSRLRSFPTRFALRLMWPYPRQRLGRCADPPVSQRALRSGAC